MATEIKTTKDAFVAFARDMTDSRRELSGTFPEFEEELKAPGVLAESAFGDTDDEDAYVVTPATQIQFVRRLTRCQPHPDGWDNPLFDCIWLPWALRVGHENHILRHPKRRSHGIMGADGWVIRTSAIAHFSWAVPTLPVISAIAAFVSGDGILEVGAGSGYWSKLLSVVGADVTALDSFAEGLEEDGNRRPLFFPVVEAKGEEYISAGRAGSRALFFCWPRNNFGAGDGFPGYGGNKVIFVGEEAGGCTADISSALVRTGEWEVVDKLYMPRWSAINDVCHLLQRCGSGK
jgi:hypothetical protein